MTVANDARHGVWRIGFVAVAAVCAAGAAAAQDRALVDTSASPHVAIRNVAIDAVRWTEGFWGDRWNLCRREMLPSIQKALLDPRNSEQLVNFRIAAGLEKGPYRGTDWSDGDCYKWLEAVSLVYALTREAELGRLLDEWIDVIGKAQRPDGFLSTNAQLSAKVNPLDMPYTHQLYNMGHLLTAACVHHEATGKETFLRIARKTADFLYREFNPRPPRLVHFPWNPSVYMGLVDLYCATGERRYLELAEILIDNRGSSPGGGDHRNGGTDQTQDRVPVREESQAVGHAVCAMYLYCGAADLYAETGEAALLKALERLWVNVTARKMYITGAVGSGGGHSSRGDPVHEAFLADYQLPSRSAYAETCSNIGHAMWNWRMLCITGEAKYADTMEAVLYNSMLSAVGAEGKTFFYCNPLAWDGQKGRGHHTGERWTIHGCYCCPPQVARTIAGLGGWAYGLSDDGVWVHLYGGNTLETALPDGSLVALRQETRYPWDGRVRITVTKAPDKEVALRLRIPGWADGATLKVCGQPADEPLRPGTYIALKRLWMTGDTVELDLPMDVRPMEAHPKVKDCQNRVAFLRGPVVYCFECPKDTDAEKVWKNGVYLPENAVFTPRHDKDFLGGMTVLTGQALTKEGKDRFICEVAGAAPPATPADWTDTLYRRFEPRRLPEAKEGTIAITLIPYFAWANRGVSYMEVWIPLAR